MPRCEGYLSRARRSESPTEKPHFSQSGEKWGTPAGGMWTGFKSKGHTNIKGSGQECPLHTGCP
jgi:hypothetical protein